MSDPLVLSQLFCSACARSGCESLWRFTGAGFLGRRPAANYECPACPATTTVAVRPAAFAVPIAGACPHCATPHAGVERCTSCGGLVALTRFEPEGFLAFAMAGLAGIDETATDAVSRLRQSEARIYGDPANPAPWRQRALLLVELGLHPLAIPHFKKAMALGGNSADDLVGLARAVAALEDPDAALVVALKAAELGPRDGRPRAFAAALCERLGRFDEACRLGRDALALDPADVDAWAMMARLHMRRKELVEALAAWHHVLAVRQDDTLAWLHRGYCHLGLGQPGDALAAAERCLAAAAGDVAAAELKIEALFAREDHEAVRVYLAERLALDARSKGLLYHQARACLALGRLDEARAAADAILVLDPRDADGLRARKAIAARSGSASQER